eukprot:scaffold55266_cov51-Phaeocystis_antarctica.AAC.1
MAGWFYCKFTNPACNTNTSRAHPGTPRILVAGGQRVRGAAPRERDVVFIINGNFQAKSTYHMTYRTSWESSH